MDLHGARFPRRQHAGREAVQQQPHLGHIVMWPPMSMSVMRTVCRCTSSSGSRSSRNRAGASVMPSRSTKGEILREARLGKGNEPSLLPQHRPLGAAQRQQLISLPQA